jgi:hypothetical protein
VPSEAARLEALGATEVTVRFRGRVIRVPLDLERWPLERIRTCGWVEAIDELIAGQFLGIADPVLDDYRDLSDALAAAVGVARLPETPATPDQWFGSIPTLLRLLHDNEEDVELDLKRLGVDYRDRWRDKLTLRQVWVYIRRSLPTSSIAVADNYGKHVWTEPDFIGAAIYQALTGELYPGRPLKPEERQRALEAMQAQAAHVDKLKSRAAHYAPPSSEAAPAGLPAAMQEAIANRQRELGASDPDG